VKISSIESTSIIGVNEYPKVSTHSSSSMVNRVSSYPKSPLRYPGGKYRAVRKILSYIPNDITELCSPFLGGASVELACNFAGVRVFGYDIFEPLINFWNTLINQKESLIEQVSDFFPLSKSGFYELQRTFSEIKNDTERATVFYVLNRSSFSGTTLSGGMSPGHPRFTNSAIKRLSEFEINNFSVKTADFKNSISKHPKTFLYLDPPYANGQALYGNRGNSHKNFDHQALAEIITKRDRWILSYNDCNLIRNLYSDFHFEIVEWTYGMNNSKTSNEVLIFSKDLKSL
jgi:DNA adenine methylase